MTRPPLPFARPSIDQNDIDAVVSVLESGWLTQGPVTRAFEEEFAAAVGAKHAIAVCSCTAALHLALDAIGVECGDKVLTTPYTFTATAEVIRYSGAEVVFADIEGPSLLWDMDAVERALTADPSIKALLPVHVAGQAVDMERLLQLADGRPIVEDAAHALPTEVRLGGGWKRIGSVGKITCFSFYATKTITSAEGGMVTTDDDALADRMRLMRLHGIDADAWRRYREKGSWGYDVVAPGFKYNISDIHSALGRSQLARRPLLGATHRHRCALQRRTRRAPLDRAPADGRAQQPLLAPLRRARPAGHDRSPNGHSSPRRRWHRDLGALQAAAPSHLLRRALPAPTRRLPRGARSLRACVQPADLHGHDRR